MTLNFKPQLPFKSMKHAAEKVYHGGNNKKFREKFDLVHNWPCIKCDGRGYLHEWTGIGSDYNDSDCIVCSNTGVISKEQFKEFYGLAIEQYRRQREIYRKRLAILKSIKSKLTKEEFQFLKYNSM